MLAQQIAGSYYATNELCESDVNESCTDGDDTSLPCYPLTDSSMCSYLRLEMRLISPTPSCFSINDIDLVSFACGIDVNTVESHYCKDNNTCADARGNECNTSLICNMTSPFISPATSQHFPASHNVCDAVPVASENLLVCVMCDAAGGDDGDANVWRIRHRPPKFVAVLLHHRRPIFESIHQRNIFDR